jgi:hypothetical protein
MTYKLNQEKVCESCGKKYMGNKNSKRCPGKCRKDYSKEHQPTRESGYLTYKKNSIKNRNLEFTLEFSEYWDLKSKPCYYCGESDKTIGIDRIDSKKGYTKENCVSSCGVCNIMKHISKIDDFINQCEKITNYQKSKRGRKK